MAQLFEEAGDQWNLDQLYHDLGQAKRKVASSSSQLTNAEQELLRGLLLGYSPSDIAEKRVTRADSTKVALSQGIYRYVEVLTGRDNKSLDSWRDVANWLDETGYRSIPVVINWTQMPDVPNLYGRQVELDQLKGYFLGSAACRMVSIIGPPGLGKTSLAVRFAKSIQKHFSGLIWQSLRYQPSLESILSQWLSHLPGVNPHSEQWYDQLNAVMTYLQEHRCLIVIDNLESIICSEGLDSSYQEGYRPYLEFLKRLVEQPHQSCVLITSHEHPPELANHHSLKQLNLRGLNYEDAHSLLAAENLPSFTQAQWTPLIQIYGGNPLMLRMAIPYIYDLFNGDVNSFLRHSTIVGGIRVLLAKQYERLSDAEKTMLKQLTDNNAPMSIEELQDPYSLDTISALRRRSLIEKSPAGFTPIPVVMEYVRQYAD